MKDAVMSFVAREKIDSVPDCAAHLKTNGELVLFFLMFYSYLLYFLNIIEGNAITVVRKMFPQLLTEVFQKALACRLPNQSLKSFFFFRTCYLKRQEIKVFRCFLRAKCVNIARNVVLVLPCFCSFNLYNFVRKVDFFSTFG